MAAGGMVDAGLALSYWYYEAFSFFALLDTHMAHNWQHVKARARGSGHQTRRDDEQAHRTESDLLDLRGDAPRIGI